MMQSNIEKDPYITIYNCTEIMTHIYRNQSINISNHQDQILEYKGIAPLHIEDNSKFFEQGSLFIKL